jgi:hypothetical protein
MSQMKCNKIKVFCDMKPCSLVGRTTVLEEPSAFIFRKEECLIIEGEGSSKGGKGSVLTKLYGVTTQKTRNLNNP